MKSRLIKGTFALTAFGIATSFCASAAELKGQVHYDYETYPDATVILIKNGVQVASAQTDHDGVYSISGVDLGEYRVRLESSDFSFSQSFTDISGPQNIHNVWLLSEVEVDTSTYFEVSGSVQDLNGRIYPNAEVRFVNNSTSNSVTLYTNEDGTYLTSLEEGTYTVNYSFYDDIDIDDNGEVDQYVNLSVNGQEVIVESQTEEDLVFPAKRIRLNALYNGELIDASSRIDQNTGEYDEVTGIYKNVSLYSYGYSVNDTDILALAGENIFGSLTPHDNSDTNVFITSIESLETTDDSARNVFEQELLDEGFIVEASVYDVDNIALNGSCLSLANESYSINVYECASGETQQVTLKVPEGNYTLNSYNWSPEWSGSNNVSNFYYFSNLAELDLTLGSERVEDYLLDVTLPVYKQRGRVIDEEGNRIEGAVVSFNEYFQISTDEFDTYTNVNHYGVTTNHNGIFEVYIPINLPQFYVEAPNDSGLANIYAEYFSSKKGQVFTITLPNEDGGVVDPEPVDGVLITGKLTNLVDNPLLLKVSLYDKDGNFIDDTLVDSNGRYSIEAPYDGQYRLEAQYNDYWTAGTSYSSNYLVNRSESFSVIGDSEFNLVVPVVSASYKVVDSDGDPISGLVIKLSGNSSPAGLHDIDYMYASHSGVSNSEGIVTLTSPVGDTSLQLQGDVLPLDLSFYSEEAVVTNTHTDIVYLAQFTVSDNDEDGVPDFYENRFGDNEAGSDLDQDGLTFLEEFQNMSSPNSSDTDGDGILDGDDVNSQMFDGLGGFNTDDDSDSDGWADITEILFGLDETSATSYPVLIDEAVFENTGLETCLSYSIYEWENWGAEYLHEVKNLNCYEGAMDDLDGISKFVNLQSLTLSQTNITDLTPVAKLTHLTALDIWPLRPTSLDFISELTKLTKVTIDLTEYQGNLTELSKLTNLTSLWLASGETVSNLDFIEDLILLETLSLQSFPLITNDLPKLANLTKLRSLTLGSTPLGELDWITALVELTDFSVRNQNDVDFTPLAQLPNLTWLDIESSNLTDISFLAGMNLYTLRLEGNNISDISVLENMTSLVYIYLTGNSALTCLENTAYYISYDELEYLCSFNPLDTDGDGLADAIDEDDDNDGILDIDDTSPLSYDANLLSAMAIPYVWSQDDGLIAYVRDMSGENEISVDVYSRASSELITSIEWQRTYAEPQVFVLDDLNTNGYADIGLFGIVETILTDGSVERKAQLFVKDAYTGETIRAFNWPANWTEMSFVKLNDVNSDGIDDFGLQGRFYIENRPQLIIKDAASGSTLKTVSYPDLLNTPVYHQLSDMNGDGLGEIGLFGRIKSNNKIQIKIADGDDTDVRLPAYNFADKWEDVSWHELFDINFDGETDFGMFGISKDDGRVQLFTKDGTDRVGTLGIFSWPEDLTSPELTVIPDMTLDGVPELAVFGYRSSVDRYQLIIKDGSDRGITLVSHGWRNNLSDVSIHVINDLNFDGKVEVAILGQRSSGAWELNINDGATGDTYRVDVLGLDWAAKPSLLPASNSHLSIADEVIIYGNTLSGNEVKYYLER
ncbi:hypothetical protein J5X92_18780 [Alteromonas sp. K632G]|uniref:hypothetical protein n=1 Tax=Alteromonas sp. K632G TaxID=2820757 RepID=UPI000C0DB236|nr:hypothetical protein [Alteromonas sp. K632G]MBO7924253.1 hypothetical protein [Alteromonas sp. K632G]PHS60097.1 MAG: hypothetical protein COB03_00615 [Alteromonas sp.]